MVLLDTGTPGTSREIYSENVDDGTRTRNPSATEQAEEQRLQYSYAHADLVDVLEAGTLKMDFS